MTFDIRVSSTAEDLAQAIVPTLVADLVASGITNADATLWGQAAEADASVRLAWVEAVDASRPLVGRIDVLRRDLLDAGVRRFVLAGMGGSALAAEVIARNAGVELIVLDSTAPGEVLAAIDGDAEGDLARTALIVSSKSGTTLETDAVRRTFEAAFRDIGVDPARRVIVVTDPDTPLARIAAERGYVCFTAEPNVGGRYAALTAYGLVPAGLAGADVGEVLTEAATVLLNVAVDAVDNPALTLAAAIAGQLPDGAARRDKLVIVEDGTPLLGLADWIEQLVAESTGKAGTGILPVVALSVSPEVEQPPVDVQIIRLVDDVFDQPLFGAHHGEILVSGTLGAQFLVWEYATAVAGRLLGVNPFDQPDVEAAKAAARALLERQPEPRPAAFVEAGIEVLASDSALTASGTVRGTLDALWQRVGPDGYVAVQAYVDRDECAPLSGIRELIAADAERPTTFGWGPRFLHSTGQFHKGGPQTGVFLQILQRTDVDLEIPGLPFTFGALIQAQADGDASVLASRGRPVVTLRLSDPQADILGLFEATD